MSTEPADAILDVPPERSWRNVSFGFLMASILLAILALWMSRIHFQWVLGEVWNDYTRRHVKFPAPVIWGQYVADWTPCIIPTLLLAAVINEFLQIREFRKAVIAGFLAASLLSISAVFLVLSMIVKAEVPNS